MCTPAEQRTLPDYFNSVIFDWFRPFWNITAAAILSSLAVANAWGGLCTILNGKLNSNGLHGSYLADGAYPDAVYLDPIGLFCKVLQATD